MKKKNKSIILSLIAISLICFAMIYQFLNADKIYVIEDNEINDFEQSNDLNELRLYGRILHRNAMNYTVNVSYNLLTLDFNESWENMSYLFSASQDYIYWYRDYYGKIYEWAFFFENKYFEFKEQLEKYGSTYNYLEVG